MKKLLFLALLVGCGGMDNAKLDQVSTAAEKAPLLDKQLGFGFMVDMTKNAAEAKAEALRGTINMTINLPDGIPLTAESIKSGFARDTLATVELSFPNANETQYTNLCAALAQRYGGPGLPYHSPDDGQVTLHWFHGPIEVSAQFRETKSEFGSNSIALEYHDLRRFKQYLNEYLTGFHKQYKQDSAFRAADLKRL